MKGLRPIAFDFGETLAHYAGAGLSWSEHYDAALAHVGVQCGCQLSHAQRESAHEVLKRYNTRSNPREHEVTSERIAGLAQLFTTVLTSVEAGFRKPNPEGLRKLAKTVNTTCTELVYVGNEPKDLQAAQRAGALPVFIDRSPRPASPNTLTIRSLEDLTDILESS